jgi:hypothetical protein
VLAISVIATALLLGGCGDDQEPNEPVPVGPLATVMADIGGGEQASPGVSWADPQLVERIGADGELIADALGSKADALARKAAELKRRYDLDPLRAGRLISMGGSDAVGVRLDGIDGRDLAQALLDDGARSEPEDGLELMELDGTFNAFGDDVAVIAISHRARGALLGEGPSLVNRPIYAAAAECLGPDVVAARIVPHKQLPAIEAGIELVAVGVTGGAEVLCALGGAPDRSDAIQKSLRVSLAPSARDPVTAAPLEGVVAGVEVRRTPLAGVEAVRAEVERTARAKAGFLLAAIPSGSLVATINGEPESFLP